MSREDLKIMQAVVDIQQYCKTHDCKNCMFGKKYPFCETWWSNAPADWNIQQIAVDSDKE